jgi:hypothetical protein
MRKHFHVLNVRRLLDQLHGGDDLSVAVDV